MVRTGPGPTDWRDLGQGNGTSGRSEHHGSLVVGIREVGTVAATRRWRERKGRDRGPENEARRIKRAAMRAALLEAQRDL